MSLCELLEQMERTGIHKDQNTDPVWAALLKVKAYVSA